MIEVMNCTCVFRPFRHSSLEKTSNSGHSESSIFKQPPPIEPPRSSPSPTHRDPPWPHGGPSPSRPSSSERPQSQKGEATSASSISGHPRGPRAYKIPSKSQLRLRKKIHNVPWGVAWCIVIHVLHLQNEMMVKTSLPQKNVTLTGTVVWWTPRERKCVLDFWPAMWVAHHLTFICYLCEWRAYYSCLL